MQVTIEMHDGTKRTYEQVDRVEDADKYKIYIYGEGRRVIAILNKGDIKNLFTPNS